MSLNVKLKFRIETRETWPMGSRKDGGFTEARLLVSAESKKDSHFSSSWHEAEIAEKRFDWQDEYSYQRAEEEALEWATQGLAETLKKLWVG